MLFFIQQRWQATYNKIQQHKFYLTKNQPSIKLKKSIFTQTKNNKTKTIKNKTISQLKNNIKNIHYNFIRKNILIYKEETINIFIDLLARANKHEKWIFSHRCEKDVKL